jgi:hypothetical protein
MVYTAGALTTVGVPLKVTFPNPSIELIIPFGNTGEKL